MVDTVESARPFSVPWLDRLTPSEPRAGHCTLEDATGCATSVGGWLAIHRVRCWAHGRILRSSGGPGGYFGPWAGATIESTGPVFWTSPRAFHADIPLVSSREGVRVTHRRPRNSLQLHLNPRKRHPSVADGLREPEEGGAHLIGDLHTTPAPAGTTSWPVECAAIMRVPIRETMAGCAIVSVATNRAHAWNETTWAHS